MAAKFSFIYFLHVGIHSLMLHCADALSALWKIYSPWHDKCSKVTSFGKNKFSLLTISANNLSITYEAPYILYIHVGYLISSCLSGGHRVWKTIKIWQ